MMGALVLSCLLGAGAWLLGRYAWPRLRELVRARRHLSAVLDKAPSTIILAGEDGTIRSINRAGAAIFGASAAALCGRALSDFLPGIEHIFGTPVAHRVAFEGRRENGARFPAEVDIATMVQDGRPHYICVARDVTALRFMKVALNESEERLLAIAANIPGMVFQCVQDPGGPAVRFTYASRGMERLLDLAAPDPGAQSGEILARLSGGDVAGLVAAMAASRARRSQLDWEARIPPGDGDERWLKLGATPRVQHNGSVVWDGVAYDITSIKREQQHLERSESSLRRLAAHIEAAREDERKRIAAEVHDELGQTLTGLRMNLSMLQQDLAGAAPGVGARLGVMKDLVDRTIRTARHVITTLRPPVLDLGVLAALEWLASDFSAHSGVRCRLRVNAGDIELDEERAIALFRIVQEALTNIGRHASASRADVFIVRRSRAILVRIDDDGAGFDSSRVDRETSFGLAGMRERVFNLKGRLTLTSVAGKGTRIRIRLPTPA